LRARPNGMTSSEIAGFIVGKPDGSRVRKDLEYLVREGYIRRVAATRPYRFHAVRM
jgi:hypothetical protein